MKASRLTCPIALTIAGSDSGGGAGAQADLKTFAALGLHGVSALTCLTAQNPRRVTAIEPVSRGMLEAQLAAVFDELPPAAIKTGLLFSAAAIRTVADFLQAQPKPRTPLVVDPVMVATSGARLLEPSAEQAMRNRLFPLAMLLTPNLDEARVLTGLRLRTAEDLRTAARQLHEQFGCAALVKGGHLRPGREAMDIYFDGRTELLLTSPRVRGVSTHGTGCTYSAAITAFLARGFSLPAAVGRAKDFITLAILHSRRAGRHDVLNPMRAAE